MNGAIAPGLIAVTSLPATLAGAPCWAVLCATLGSLVMPLAEYVRALRGDQDGRRLDALFIASVEGLAEPERRTRMIIQYRQARDTTPPRDPAADTPQAAC
ncbi:hypothetical protein [Streptomyces specialis]|uniref:hypothetical protein n=1 Tax=Streptomyces specialis TaxID=498367 RepID=UPI00073F964A|nr:hypothetical protein [Streptomyces specialis]